jgi:hypothetical protein
VHTKRILAHPLVGHRCHADHFQHLVHPTSGQPVGGGQVAKMVASGTTWVHVLGVEQRSHFSQGLLQLTEFLAIEEGPSGCCPIQPEHATHRCRLTGTVRTKEAGDAPITDLETQIVHNRLATEPFGESLNVDHGPDVRPLSGALCVRLPGGTQIAGRIYFGECGEEEIVFLG